MGKLRFLFALWAAKLSGPILKITRHNGTNFPGKLAVKLCPDFLKYIGKPEKTIAVTGTNGKTTVSNLLCDMLEESGERVLHNRLGSNIVSGIATSLISGCGMTGKTRYSLAVLEVDERSALRIFPYIKPNWVIITNLFRDSIMRNAHPAYIAGILTRAIPSEAKLILNADDMIACSVAPKNPRVYFGIRKMDTDVTECVNLINDVRICPNCCGKLIFDYRRYHHIGRAHCESCGFTSPDYDYAADTVDFSKMLLSLSEKNGEKAEYPLLSDSIFNVYNMVTAIAVMRELGKTHAEILPLYRKTAIVESRHFEEKVGKIDLIMQMSKDKNALAGSRVFDYVSGRPGKKEIFLMMNCLSDQKHWSENTCWLYDCDFEFLNRENIGQIVCTGPRGKDYRLRLLLAGVPEEKIFCETDELEAAKLLKLTPGDSVYVFYGTDSYTLALKVKDRIRALAEEAEK